MKDYGRQVDAATRQRLALVQETIHVADGDMYSVHEIIGDTASERVEIFVELAATLGMECMAIDGRTGTLAPVFDPCASRRGVGVMWRPDRIRAVPGSVRTYEHAGLGTGMALVILRVEERVNLTVASTHLRPRRPNQRADDCTHIGAEVYGMGLHGIVGADWNNVFASLDPMGNDYDPDPYAGRAWHPRHIGKATPDYATGFGVARRGPMRELHHAGLFDPAAYISAPWYRTVGHWKADAIDKRIDGPITTESVAAATLSIRSLDQAPAHGASDHLPVLHDINLDLLRTTE